LAASNLLFQQDPGKYRENRNSPAVPQVLTRFEVQPAGANVRIIDADGSVYAGAAAPEANEAQPFSFRAVGTNKSLNQLVVFTGTFEPPRNGVLDNQADLVKREAQVTTLDASAQRQDPTRVSAASVADQTRQSTTANNLLQQGRIQGQVVVGSKSQLTIDAQQVPQPGVQR
jgi:hypothetical protein